MSEDYNFFVTTNPPEPKKPFGAHAGRARMNPFDTPLQRTWEQKFVDRDEWLEFKVDPPTPANVRRAVNRIRAAGQHLHIGTEVRVVPESGRVVFRGCEYKPRRPRSTHAPADPVAASAPAGNVPPGPAVPTAQPEQPPAWPWNEGSAR